MSTLAKGMIVGALIGAFPAILGHSILILTYEANEIQNPVQVCLQYLGIIPMFVDLPAWMIFNQLGWGGPQSQLARLFVFVIADACIYASLGGGIGYLVQLARKQRT